ncbi:MAG: hypothetical protein M3Q44_05395 [bacterium]|nr:hypothetical protein [bacterium]
MKTSQEKDALLALISTLTVVFVVLFFSIAYFMTLRVDVTSRQAILDRVLAEQRQRDQLRAQQAPGGDVAGAETEESLDVGDDY